MNLLCKIGHPLTYRHTVKLEMESGFDFRGEYLFVNKHIIKRTRGANPSIKFDPERDRFRCRTCASSYSLNSTFSRCQNCGVIKPYKGITNIGKSLSVCNACYKQIISYKAFDIFAIFSTSLSKVKEIDIDNFHDYNWNEILALFNGEKLSATPPNRGESSGGIPSNLTVRSTRNNQDNLIIERVSRGVVRETPFGIRTSPQDSEEELMSSNRD